MNVINNNNRKLIVGVYDSGIGGVPVYNKLNYQLQTSNFKGQVATRYLGDTKNFPYGTKTTHQLEKIISTNLVELSEMGCSIIGIACNTASYVYNSLTKYNVNPNILPILDSAVEEVLKVNKGNVHVISSNYTAKVHAYKNAVTKADKNIKVTESGEQLLIRVIEQNDRREINRELERIISKLPKETDTLVLGCTHFSHIKDTIGDKIEQQSLDLNIVEPTELMVDEIMKRVNKILINTSSIKDNEVSFSGNRPKFLFND